MTTRTTQTIVVFKHAFSLNGVEGELPAGSYLIESEEEQIATLSIAAYRRVATTIALPSIGTPSLKRQVATIAPDDLAAAQEGDAAYAS